MKDADEPDIRPPTAAELADVRVMHASNRAAWDEAAERYEGWLEEAIALIRAGGTNLLPPELELIGDLHGRCRRAIHLQCAGGRDTLSLWTAGADEVVGIDFSPRMLDLARRLTEATGAPARWIEADVLDAPGDLDGTGDLVYTGRGSLMWLQDLDAWAAVLHRLLAPTGRLVIFEGHPAEWLFDVDDGRALDRDRLRLLRWRRGVARLGAGVHRPPVGPGRRAVVEVRAGLDARRDRHGATRRRAPHRTPGRASDRLVGRSRGRRAGRTRADPVVVLGPGQARRRGG